MGPLWEDAWGWVVLEGQVFGEGARGTGSWGEGLERGGGGSGGGLKGGGARQDR